MSDEIAIQLETLHTIKSMIDSGELRDPDIHIIWLGYDKAGCILGSLFKKELEERGIL